MNAQDNTQPELPFEQIPDYPDTYTPQNLVVRMIDGLGYRYYWATEGLLEETLPYRPSEDSRSVRELLQHIYALTGVILNSAKKQTNGNSVTKEWKDLSDLRAQTLYKLEEARLLFSAAGDLSSHKIIFLNSGRETEFPFWNQINGALEDAVWHSGQIAILRRAAGNPMASGVNPFLGITKK